MQRLGVGTRKDTKNKLLDGKLLSSHMANDGETIQEGVRDVDHGGVVTLEGT